MVDSVINDRMKELMILNMSSPQSTLMTDESPIYYFVDGLMKHKSVNHNIQYVDGALHTNTIEAFWSLLKRAWHGIHHHYSKRYRPLYVAEACYKNSHQNTESLVDAFIRDYFS